MQPNIILLMPDQQRADWLGCAGHRFVRTPCIDALAAAGVRFPRAITPYPLCGPARMALMTGRHPWRQECWINEDCLDSNAPCFTHALARLGYECVLAGRMHFTGPDQRHGFHRRVGTDFCRTRPGGPNMPMPPGLEGSASSARRALETAGVGDNPVLAYDEDVTLAAERLLHERAVAGGDRPLLLTVGWYGPHNPYRCDQAAYDRVVADQPADDAPLPCGADDLAVPWVRDWLRRQRTDDLPPERLREARRCYAAMVGEVDRRCARVLERARALPGPTIAIYLSDHGDLMGDHGLTAKTAFYEGSLGVPLIIAPVNAAGAAWLGARAGAVVDAPVSLLDLAPTLTGLAMTPEQRAADALVPASDSAWGANRPIALPGSDGRDLSPLLRDPSLAADPAWAERPVFSEMNVPFLPPARCVVRGRYKYVHYHGAGEQLFDLGDDPGEARNRAADLPELSTELRRLALQGWDAQRCLESRAARLRDCGYVTASAAAYPGAGDEVFLNRRV